MGTDTDDKGSNPENNTDNRNAEGKQQCLEDPTLEERGYHVEITDTEVSTMVCNLFNKYPYFF